jgi:hypothetical protein
MRALLTAVIVMGVLIVGGTIALGVLVAKRLAGPPAAGAHASLDEPPGTRIAGIAAVKDGLALNLQGAGPDRVVIVDPSSGRVTARIGLAR